MHEINAISNHNEAIINKLSIHHYKILGLKCYLNAHKNSSYMKSKLNCHNSTPNAASLVFRGRILALFGCRACHSRRNPHRCRSRPRSTPNSNGCPPPRPHRKRKWFCPPCSVPQLSVLEMMNSHVQLLFSVKWR